MRGKQSKDVLVEVGVGAGLAPRSEDERSGARPAALVVVPDPEVPAQARRRRFTAQQKLALLQEADRCQAAGELGALLRRHGLYSSHLSRWCQQRAGGELAGLAPRKRGPAPSVSAEQRRIRELEARLEQLERELSKAQLIIDVQRNLRARAHLLLAPETPPRLLSRLPERRGRPLTGAVRARKKTWSGGCLRTLEW
ncbi:MAG TPA: transposase [Thermoanaerobaculia bacterium]|nr:transposase [Thermoanaerobaculia bacterium]